MYLRVLPTASHPFWVIDNNAIVRRQDGTCGEKKLETSRGGQIVAFLKVPRVVVQDLLFQGFSGADSTRLGVMIHHPTTSLLSTLMHSSILGEEYKQRCGHLQRGTNKHVSRIQPSPKKDATMLTRAFR